MAVERSVICVILVFFIYKAAESLLQPSVRLFIVETVCESLAPPGNSSACRHGGPHLTAAAAAASAQPDSLENRSQAAAASYLLAYRIALNLPAIFLSLCCGAWSDRVGRKLPLILPSLGAAISTFILSFALRPDWLPPLAVVMAGALVYGVFGKSAVVTMAANSYLTDVSSEAMRTRLLGSLLGVNFLGIFVGSLLVGLSQTFSSIGPALTTVSLLNGAVVAIVVFHTKESREPSCNDKKEERCGCPLTLCRFGMAADTLRLLGQKRQGRRQRFLLFLFFSMLLNQLCKSGEQDAILLFVQHAPLNWSGELYGYYLCLYYACMGLNLLLVLPVLSKTLAPRDTTLIMAGLVLKIARLLMTAFAGPSTALVFSAAVLGSGAGLIVSATKSLISKLAGNEDDVGKTFALLSSIEAFSNLLGPAIFNGLYAVTVAIFPGFVFVLDACLHLCLLCLFLRLHFELRDDEARSAKLLAE